jgi:hypothetical protein
MAEERECTTAEKDAIDRATAALRAKLATARELVERLQWGTGTCPVCRRIYGSVHHTGCPVGAWLAEVEK